MMARQVVSRICRKIIALLRRLVHRILDRLQRQAHPRVDAPTQPSIIGAMSSFFAARLMVIPATESWQGLTTPLRNSVCGDPVSQPDSGHELTGTGGPRKTGAGGRSDAWDVRVAEHSDRHPEAGASSVPCQPARLLDGWTRTTAAKRPGSYGWVPEPKPPARPLSLLERVVSGLNESLAVIPAESSGLSHQATEHQVRRLISLLEAHPNGLLAVSEAPPSVDEEVATATAFVPFPAGTRWERPAQRLCREGGHASNGGATQRDPQHQDRAPEGGFSGQRSVPGSSELWVLSPVALRIIFDALLSQLGTAPQNSGEKTVEVIKIVILPRGLVIRIATMTLSAFLHAHGLGLFAPECARQLSRLLGSILNALFGRTPYGDLIKTLNQVETLIYAENGRLADSPYFRDRLRDWFSHTEHGRRKPPADHPHEHPGPNTAGDSRTPAPDSAHRDASGSTPNSASGNAGHGSRPHPGNERTNPATGQQGAPEDPPSAARPPRSSAAARGDEPVKPKPSASEQPRYQWAERGSVGYRRRIRRADQRRVSQPAEANYGDVPLEVTTPDTGDAPTIRRQHDEVASDAVPRHGPRLPTRPAPRAAPPMPPDPTSTPGPAASVPGPGSLSAIPRPDTSAHGQPSNSNPPPPPGISRPGR